MNKDLTDRLIGAAIAADRDPDLTAWLFRTLMERRNDFDPGELYSAARAAGADERSAARLEGLALAAVHGLAQIGVAGTSVGPDQRIILTPDAAAVARQALAELFYGRVPLPADEFQAMTGFLPEEAQTVLDCLDIALESHRGRALTLKPGDEALLGDTGESVKIERRLPGDRLKSGFLVEMAEVRHRDGRVERGKLSALSPA